MVLRVIPYRPGEIRDDGMLAAEGYAASTQLIEWVRGRAQTWPGWATISSNNSVGSAGRGLGAFADTSAQKFLGIGTPSLLFVYVDNTATAQNVTPDRYDITPLSVNFTSGASTVTIGFAKTNQFVTSAGGYVRIYGGTAAAGIFIGGSSGNLSGSSFVTKQNDDVVVINLNNTLASGDGIVVGSVATVGGIVPSGYYDAFNLGGSDFSIQHTSPATSSETGGGASASYMVAKSYRIASVNAQGGLVFAAGTVANTTVSITPSSTFRIRVTITPGAQRHWSIVPYGGNMIATPYQGVPARWYNSYLARARFLTNAPAQSNWALISPEGYLICFGCTDTSGNLDEMLIRWSDSTDINNFTASTTSNAGSTRLGQGSAIVGALNTQGGTLVWTDNALYLLRYTGQQDAQYVAELVGTGCGLIGALAAVEQDGVAYWISPAGQCFVYAGGRPRAMQNPNEKYFRDNLASGNVRAQIAAAFDVSRTAVMWLWPFTGATENNRYMRCNLLENARDPNAGWSLGVIDRTVWLDRGQFANPIAVSSGGLIYVHDSGNSDNGAAVTRSLERAPIDISSQEEGDGGVKMVIRRIVFGRTHSGGTATAQLIGQDWEIDSTPQTKTYSFATSTPYQDVRMQARQFGFRWQTTGSNDFLREGNIRLDVSRGTRR